MSVRPWRAEIRFYKMGKLRPGNLGAGNLGSYPFSIDFHQILLVYPFVPSCLTNMHL